MPGAISGRNDYVNLARVHVNDPTGWSYKAGTDFWVLGGNSGMLTSGSAHELPDYGWTATAMGLAAGAGANLLDPTTPGAPGRWVTDAAADLLQSPAIFGDYAHGLQAAKVSGMRSLPRQLILEALAAFTVASANEPGTGFGFIEDTGVPGTVADHLAFVRSNGTLFDCRSGADNVVGRAVDNLYHLFRVTLNRRGPADVVDQVVFAIDDQVQGTLDLENAEFPVSFGLIAGTTNRVQLAWAHIFYDW